MVDDKMCIGLNRDKSSGEDRMMVRVGKFAQDLCMKRTGCRAMEFTGRPMKGFVYVDPEGFDMDEDQEFWIEKALDYNPLAKRSKKQGVLFFCQNIGRVIEFERLSRSIATN